MRESGSERVGDALFRLRNVVGVGAGAGNEDILMCYRGIDVLILSR